MSKNFLLKTVVQTYVDAVNENDGLPLRITYESFDFYLLQGALKLKGLQLTPKKEAERINLNLEFRASAIKVDGVNIQKLLSKNIDVEKVELIAPKLVYYIQVDAQGKPLRSEVESTEDTIQSPSPWVEALKTSELKHVTFRDGDVSVFKVHKDTLSFLQLHGYEIDYHEESVGVIDHQFSNSIHFDSAKFYLGKEFTLMTDALDIELSENELKVNDVRLVNNEDKLNFLHGLKFKKDWKEFRMKKVHLKGLDIGKLEHIQFQMDSVLVDDLSIAVAERGDLTKKKGHRGKMMNDWFMSIPEMIDFEHVKVNGGKVDYQMINAPFMGTLNIPFTIHTINLAHHQEEIKIKIKAKIFNSPLFSTMVLATNESYKSNISVRVEQIQSSWFNQLGTPLFGGEIVKGDISLLDFYYHYSGVHAKAIGRMDFRYRGLKLKLAQRKKKNRKKTHGLLSFAANTIIKHNNYPGMPGYVRAPIAYERTLDQSFFGHMIKCMLSGMEYTVLKTKEPKEEDH